MAAPIKQGLDYFPLDVTIDNDDKLGMIIGEFDYKGEMLYIKLLSYLYQHGGYYIEWNEEIQLKFLRRYNYCGFSKGFINEVVPRFIKWGLFDKGVFNEFQILTSIRIQKTWLEASRKRTGRQIISNIWIIPVSDAAKVEVIELTPEVMGKGKESKENQMKGKGAQKAPAAPDLVKSLVLEKFSEGFVTIWQKWLDYKKAQFKFQHKHEESHRAAISELHNLSEGNETTAGAIIMRCMGNGWKGFFVDDKPPARNQQQGQAPPPPKMFDTVKAKMAGEINYLYERYMEGTATVITIDVLYYNHLKNLGMVNFTEEIRDGIKKKAHNHIVAKSIAWTEETQLNFMKKFGVLEYFSQLKEQGKTIVFDNDHIG